MIDPQLLKNNFELIQDNLKKRDLEVDLEKLKSLDEDRRAIKFESEKLRSEQKKLGKDIATTEGEQKNKLLKKAEKLSEKVKELSDKNQKKDEQFFNEWIKIPNIVDPSSPVGKTDEDNKELKKVGTPKNIVSPLSHLNIGENLGLINVEKASSVSGSRFSYLFGDLVKIQFNIVSFAMNKLSEKGFNPTIPPVLVRENALYGTGFFPDDSDQVYEIPNDDLFLVGTSEVSLAALHSDEIVSYDSLPIRYAGYSTCFRREAGTYGKDTSGIFRVHQFDKVEMFSFCSPEKSDEEHEFILSIEEEILQELEIPYRVVDVCTGDLGSSAAKKYDIEAWIPSQEQYREVTSCSNTTDFQSRRLNIRTKIDKNSTLLHTLNGTAIAVGRILIALLENNQTKDGNVEFSENLSKILGINKLSK